jgi:hypothetical protein
MMVLYTCIDQLIDEPSPTLWEPHLARIAADCLHLFVFEAQ